MKTTSYGLILPTLRSMGLDTYLFDKEVSEIMITNGKVFIDRAGKLIEIEGLVIDERKLQACIAIIGQSLHDHIDDYHKPWLDSRLPDGSRVAVTYPPISPLGVLLTIRKFLRHFTTDELLERGSLEQPALTAILAGIHGRKNILFSGGTSTGKTTMANAFVRHIPAHERIVVIEKPIEMNIEHRNSPRLEAYPGIGNRPAVTISQLLEITLRHRPDRIIVGEVKDPGAAYGLLQAMNTGHDGTVSTIHANTAKTALTRLASLAMPGFGSLDLARQETAAAINLIVEVTRSTDGWRGVSALLEVHGYDTTTHEFATTEIYRRQATAGVAA